ncbi:MAG: AraC family transcriptional regulator, partial [Bacteroidota bacterium]
VLSLPEFKRIRQLVEQAKAGLFFSSFYRQQVGPMLERLTQIQGVEGLLCLFSIFDQLAKDPAMKHLCSSAYLPALDELTERRILIVCQYIHEHYTEPLRISTLAELAKMNTSAFSRFFSKTTGQTVTNYLTELRLAKACNLLVSHPKMAIGSVAHQSGFNSQTLFNRCFKQRKGSTPREFRRQLQPYL